MSSGGQIAGAVVGAVVGFFAYGGPVGAVYGAAYGAALGGALDPPKGPTVSGPRLSDLTVQTSTYGAFIPRIYGTVGISGNIVWLENNRLRETSRKKKSGGKGGGGSSTIETFSYSATFILALCQGPIVGVRRIWCMDKLIYNAGSDDLETIIASNQAASGWRLYLGTDDQMPDPRYEASVGAGNAPAYRGVAYLAFYDFALADFSNTLQAAQFKVEVVGIGANTVSQSISFSSATGATSARLTHNPFGRSNSSYYSIIHPGDISPTLYARRINGIVQSIKVPRFENIWEELGYDVDYSISNSFSNSSLDTLSAVFWTGADGDGSTPPALITADDFSFGNNTLAYDFISPGFYERAGFLFVSFSLATGFPAVSGRKYVARLTRGGGVYEIEAYSDLFTVSSCIIPKYDGGVVSVNFQMESLQNTATVTVSSYDQEFDIINTGTFTLTRSDAMGSLQVTSASSVGYQADDGTLWVSIGNLSAPGNPSLPGTGAYLHISTSPVSLIGYYELNNFPVGIAHVPSSITFRDGLIASSMFSGVGRYDIVANAPFILDAGQFPVSQIIQSEVSLSSLLTDSDVSVSGITSSTRGYRVSGGSIRSAIEPLQAAFPFDVIQSGYKIKCVPRGQVSLLTVPWSDLGASDSSESVDFLKETREMDTQLPASTTITVIDAGREYSVLPQTSERIGTEAVNRVDREIPVVLTADEAAGVAEVLQNLAWLERSVFTFSLPPTYLGIEPSDIVTVDADDAVYQLRIAEAQYSSSGRIMCTARKSAAGLFIPSASGGSGIDPEGSVPLLGASVFVPLDIPVVDELVQNDVGFVGAMTGITSGWPGAILVRSNDDGQTWAEIQGFSGKATIGTARGTLPVSSCTLIDSRGLIVDLLTGEIESVTRDQMLLGANYAAYGADGRWEIIRFQNAALQSDGSYIVSGFVRGDRGTEWTTGLHQAGDYFVLLDDPDNIFIGSPIESIGLGRLYRGVTAGASIDSASDVSFEYDGVNLKCLSPVYGRGVRDVSGNFSGSFTRRSRLSSSWWTNGVEAQIGEESESYQIDVINGSSVVRTISVGSPAFSYSAADQTTDFGSAQSSIIFRIYQISAVVGRGYAYEVSL
ncbi:phage tail protein [Ectopseudomonas composti]|uniref:phage tail protein n=1 Tax=Ectopseudomonas composti TaxID=658457 RepID=UPI0009EAACC2|nr:phage tail protein [Pseudomonas composti]